jgi:hypothetical protein
MSKGGRQYLARLPEGVNRPRRRRRRVVDLVREPGRQGAQGDQGLLLSGHGLKVAYSSEQPLDEVGTEREPGARPLSQGRGRHSEDTATQ